MGLFKEFGDFLERLDERKAARVEAARIEKREKRIKELKAKRGELLIKRDRAQAEFTHLTSFKGKTWEQVDDDARLNGHVAAWTAEITVIDAELKDLADEIADEAQM